LFGGSGSGKSIFAVQKILIRCLNEQGHRILVVRKIANTIQNSVFKAFGDLIAEYNVSNLVTANKTNLSYHFNNGNEILTTGLDDVEKLKSIQGITSIWIEEATELEKTDFDQLDLRLRGETSSYKQFIITFNPIDETHWIKAELFDKELDNRTICHSTYLDNKFIDEEYIKLLTERIAGDENLYRIYVKGEWGRIKTGAEFYSSFKFNKHVRQIENDESGTYHISFDQNVVPYISCTIAQISKEDDKYILKFIDEIALSNPRNKTECLCDEFLTRYTDVQRIFYYGDASGKKRDTRSQYNDYDIVERKFKRFLSNTSNRVPYSNPSVTKRRDFINRIFDDRYPIEVIIDPKCKYLIADLESVKEDIDGTKLKKKVLDKVTGQSYEPLGHCFVGNTLIKTMQGYKEIKNISPGDYVLTRIGYKKVIKWFDNGLKPVKTYSINGNKIICTEDHKIYANNGFYPIGQLIDKNIFIIFDEKKLWKEKLLSIMGINLTGTQIQQEDQIKSILVDGLKLKVLIKKLGFMFINIYVKWAKYLVDIAYIIKMGMHKIMKLKICNVFQNQNTQAITCNQKEEKIKAEKHYLNLHNQKLSNGMDQKQEENGIKSTQKKYWLKLLVFVLNVIKNMKDLFHIKTYNIAAQNVKTDTICEKIENLGNGMKQEPANVVVNHLRYISGVKQKIVQENAHKIERVYDIQVEDCHEYFANNILVHNCSDCYDYQIVTVFRSFFDNMQFIK
jgi:PBSX family phage terminase large subunit